MLPSTFLGLLLFLLLVTPGFLYNAMAARRRVLQDESTFMEISRVVLASVGFSTVSVAILLAVHAGRPHPELDLGRLATVGELYVRQKAGVLITYAAIELALACLIATGANWLIPWVVRKITGRKPPRLKAESAWTPLIHACPVDASPHAWVRLRSGLEVRGKIQAYGHEIDVSDRELVLGPPLEVRYPNQPSELPQWQYFVIQGSDIESLAVKYVANKPKA